MTFKEKFLAYMGITIEEYEELTKSIDKVTLPDSYKFQGMEEAVKIIKDTMKNNEKIIIYGDYDCDGIMSTSILYRCFLNMNYEVGYYIPSRYIDGYGLNVKRVKEIKDKGYSLIITVDNGISQFEAIEEAKKLGMKVIVTDHHEPKEELPICDVILHPMVSKYGDINCCGAYVSYMLATAILGKEDKYLLSLAAIATISDMMVLKSYNRDIVRLGLKYLNEENFLPIMLLKKDEIINEKTIGMQIAPKINAVGRVLKDTKINILVKYFAENADNLQQISRFIDGVNDRRKEITNDAFITLPELKGESAIILNLDIDEGLIGLVANRLVNEYNCPTIIFTEDSMDSTILKGSARSKNGLAINLAFENVRDLLLSYGGHELAGGLSIKKKDFDLFKSRFIAYSKEHPLVELEENILEISILDINKDNYNIIESLSPYGNGFPAPVFKIPAIKTKEISFSKDHRHIMMNIGLNQKIIGFNQSLDEFKNSDSVGFVGTLEKSYFRGNTSIKFRIEEIVDSNLIEI